MGNNLVAIKCVDEGKIMVLRLAKLDEGEIEKKRKIKADVVAIYRWRKTDNFYMNIGCNKSRETFQL